jgi:hypothetical protein
MHLRNLKTIWLESNLWTPREFGIQAQPEQRPYAARVPVDDAGRGSGQVEVHWYEATGIGRKEFKIKHFLD